MSNDHWLARIELAEARANAAEGERDRALAGERLASRVVARHLPDAVESAERDAALLAAEERVRQLSEVVDRLVAPNEWRFADGSEVGIPEGTFVVSGISAAESIDEAMPWNAVSDDDDDTYECSIMCAIAESAPDGLGAALDGEG